MRFDVDRVVLPPDRVGVGDGVQDVARGRDRLNLVLLLFKNEQHQRDSPPLRDLPRHWRLLQHPEDDDGRHPVQVQVVRVCPKSREQNLDPVRPRDLRPLPLRVGKDGQCVAAGLDELPPFPMD